MTRGRAVPSRAVSRALLRLFRRAGNYRARERRNRKPSPPREPHRAPPPPLSPLNGPDSPPGAACPSLPPRSNPQLLAPDSDTLRLPPYSTSGAHPVPLHTPALTSLRQPATDPPCLAALTRRLTSSLSLAPHPSHHSSRCHPLRAPPSRLGSRELERLLKDGAYTRYVVGAAERRRKRPLTAAETMRSASSARTVTVRWNRRTDRNRSGRVIILKYLSYTTYSSVVFNYVSSRARLAKSCQSIFRIQYCVFSIAILNI